jgi:Domain of unknown function (DUF4440)
MPLMYRVSCETLNDRRRRKFSILLALILTSPCIAFGRAQSATNSTIEPHTEAAVIAADKGWDKAEGSGDTDYIDHLLLPEYRSISPDGSVHDKAAILASARKHVASPDSEAAADKWRTEHPSLTSVIINGDTAILTFTLNRSGSPKSVLSSDIFVYRDGHWHAIYSQHSTAG